MTYLEVLCRSALLSLSFHKTPPTIHHAQLCHPPIYSLGLGHLLSLSMFFNSNTDKMSQNAKTFSLPYWTLREWWASCCSTQQILASADYETGETTDLWSALGHCSSRLLLLWPPTCPGWASLAPSIYSKYISPCFRASILMSGRMLLTIWSLLPSRTTSAYKTKGC